MHLEGLRELQRRGRFFYEMFPGVKASDEWQRQRDLLNDGEKVGSSLSSTITADDPQKDPQRT